MREAVKPIGPGLLHVSEQRWLCRVSVHSSAATDSIQEIMPLDDRCYCKVGCDLCIDTVKTCSGVTRHGLSSGLRQGIDYPTLSSQRGNAVVRDPRSIDSKA